MTFEEATNKALKFRQDRDWEQFHNPKDLAISINLEAAELLEAFQWSGTDVTMQTKHDYMTEELADIVIYCIYLADSLGVSLAEAINSKLEINSNKYPVDISRGNSKKYSELK